MRIKKPQIHIKRPDLKKVFDIIDKALRAVKVPPP